MHVYYSLAPSYSRLFLPYNTVLIVVDQAVLLTLIHMAFLLTVMPYILWHHAITLTYLMQIWVTLNLAFQIHSSSKLKVRLDSAHFPLVFNRKGHKCMPQYYSFLICTGLKYEWPYISKPFKIQSSNKFWIPYMTSINIISFQNWSDLDFDLLGTVNDKSE